MAQSEVSKRFNQAADGASKTPVVELVAASLFLTRLAARLEDAIQQKIDNNEVVESDQALGSVATIDDQLLKNVSLEKVRELGGYADLSKACKKLNICLEAPFPLYKAVAETKPCSQLQIFLDQPHDKSRAVHVEAEQNPGHKVLKSKGSNSSHFKTHKP